ncbi:helix-turn-helix domain-containing protein [Thermoactinomyces intermedius]|uniref:Helix-turn-helix domain-containing protein n=1 Tax=Thermoactinomyces intermedius TaxID=2024 RepID=A0A8I1DFD4_THEIN|nr:MULTISPECIES: helix-turn-helix transcriptional regulator [Thermoactinomyces]MBA4549605.1 helix-turn-helix domain-containing protein [Thermoactinomyces intermedius]MBA4837086.1 helix-turn-helix domain-containing protein [Thermoactinomyces intermedius]MBH8595964.1 helix-turn-helix domain-containing protein [Thermoactinomyces intermedius]MBH8602226.1 helix-turn-helix domain-containing protein [Thermoactinomyces sp. CICC 23799]
MSVEIGRRLRRAREASGLTLEEVERRTRISKRELLAMEQGRFQFHPNPAYVRSCVRAYATVVGENPQRMLNWLQRAQERTTRREPAVRRNLPDGQGNGGELSRSRRRSNGYGRSQSHTKPDDPQQEDYPPQRQVYRRSEREGMEAESGEGEYSRRSRRQASKKKTSVFDKIYSYFLLSGAILLVIATICFLWFRWSNA